MQRFRIILGIIFWAASIATAILLVRREVRTGHETESALTVVRQIGHWVTDQKTQYTVDSRETLELAIGDPILVRGKDGRYRQVGVVLDNFNPSKDQFRTRRATVSIYDEALNETNGGFRLMYYSTPESLDWVAATIIPPERLQQIVELIAADWKIHQQEIIRQLTPLIQEGVRRGIAAIEAELPAAIQSHRNQFTRLGDRYRTEIMQRQILPLIRDRILPIIQEELSPLLNEIGISLWKRVSLWSFTWRYFYDVSPLPERNAVKKEFDRFLEEEAVPELQAHSSEFIAVTESIISKLSRDPAINQTVRRSLRTVAADPELHSIIWSIIRHSVLQNQKLRESLDDYSNSQQAKELLRLTSARLEPTARAIGDLIIGSRTGGVTPEFARILRAQILLKDRHWLILVPVAEETPQTKPEIVRGTQEMMFPLTFEGAEQSPLSDIR